MTAVGLLAVVRGLLVFRMPRQAHRLLFRCILVQRVGLLVLSKALLYTRLVRPWPGTNICAIGLLPLVKGLFWYSRSAKACASSSVHSLGILPAIKGAFVFRFNPSRYRHFGSVPLVVRKVGVVPFIAALFWCKLERFDRATGGYLVVGRIGLAAWVCDLVHYTRTPEARARRSAATSALGLIPDRARMWSGTWAHRCHICTGTGLTAATSAPGLGSPRPHLRRDWSHRCHICIGTGLTAATSAPGLGSPLPHLHRDWDPPLPHLHRDWAHRCAAGLPRHPHDCMRGV